MTLLQSGQRAQHTTNKLFWPLTKGLTKMMVCLLPEPIAEDYRNVVCPFIDVIDYENFAYRAQDEGARGAFDWEFFYKRLPLLERDKKHPAEPFE